MVVTVVAIIVLIVAAFATVKLRATAQKKADVTKYTRDHNAKLRIYQAGDTWTYALAGTVALKSDAAKLYSIKVKGVEKTRIEKVWDDRGYRYIVEETQSSTGYGIRKIISSKLRTTYLQNLKDGAMYRVGDEDCPTKEHRDIAGQYPLEQAGSFPGTGSISASGTYSNGDTVSFESGVVNASPNLPATPSSASTPMGTLWGWNYRQWASTQGQHSTPSRRAVTPWEYRVTAEGLYSPAIGAFATLRTKGTIDLYSVDMTATLTATNVLDSSRRIKP
jgi:hypothetical protein